MKRFLDIVFSLTGLLILSPVFLILSCIIKLEDGGKIFYRQIRVGRNGKDFKLYKFRSMSAGSDKKGLLTVGANDNRVTKSGKFIRKYKLDEIPQLINVLIADMSLVGPRPEVRKYVDLYTKEQSEILRVVPGITDYASIEYSDENELLSKSDNPEKLYIDKIMPDKIKLNMKYINNRTLFEYFKIITITFLKIVKIL